MSPTVPLSHLQNGRSANSGPSRNRPMYLTQSKQYLKIALCRLLFFRLLKGW
jgi:hypothetical protein